MSQFDKVMLAPGQEGKVDKIL